MKIKFFGAANRVTGSNYMLSLKDMDLLIDCGAFQGGPDTYQKNHEAFPYDPKAIKAIIITHSHIDHIGRLPKLVKEGFRGPIYSTRPAKDFSDIFLADELRIMTEAAKRENFQPFYSQQDLDQTLKQWETFDYHEPFAIGSAKVEFFDAGHILGAAITKITNEGKVVVFSGDLGNPPVPIIAPTEEIKHVNFLVIESTYGNRFHEAPGERKNKLERAIEDVDSRGGVLLIPAFAMERTQELLYEMNDLVTHHRVRQIPVYVDSPLAIKATEIYKKYESYFNKDARYLIDEGEDIFSFPGLIISKTKDDSKMIETAPNPKVILAGSGMSTGGRIMFHERAYLSDPKNMILFVGYQVRGTLGRQIKEGEKNVRIFGEEVAVRAEVREIDGYSAHGDQNQLFDWVAAASNSGQTLERIFVTHGEPEAAEALAERIRDELGIDTTVPNEGEEAEL